MKITYKKNGRKKTCEFNPAGATDKCSAALGILWNEKRRGQNLDPEWGLLENDGSVSDARGTLELISFEPSELEKKGFFDYGMRQSLNKKCKQGYAILSSNISK